MLIYQIILFLHKVRMALSLLYLLLLCIGTKCTSFIYAEKKIMLIYGAYYYDARVHIGI